MANPVSIRVVSGTSTERGNIPASTAIGIEFRETDTGAAYYSDGSSWLKKITSGAEHVRQVATEVAFPQQWYIPFTGTAGVNDNDVVYTSTDVSLYDIHVIECTAGTVDIQVTVDGTNYNTTQAAVMLHDDITTGGGVRILTIASGKIGILRGKYKGIKVLQNGATASNARGGHGVGGGAY